MDNYDIIIFGAGIAGLTVAHQLALNSPQLKIAIIEKENIIGGMARTSRYSDNLPTEHSWRGYAPFYYNTYDLMKQIPIDNNKTVYDNLKPGINFVSTENDINNNKNSTISDYFILIYWILYYFFSGNLRSEDNKTFSFANTVSNISTNSKNKYIEFIGPGIGLDTYSASLFHIGKFIEMSYQEPIKSWNFMNQPTSEAWFDPWYKLLKNKVNFFLSSELQELNFDNNNVVTAKILTNNGTRLLTGKNYVIALNPYAVTDLYKNNKLGTDPELDKFKKITYGEPHIQISFRLAFDQKINIKEKDAFIFPNSNLNITMYPQDTFWEKNIDLGNNIKSLWSGTACVTYKMSELYKKRCDELNIGEFLDEVIHEISNSKEFDQYLIDNNNKPFNKLTITKKEVWYEWKFDNNRLESRNKKWVNTLNNNNRPLYTTHYNNLFITGSHCETGLSIWSMESAVESGNRCVIEINKKLGLNNKFKLHTHTRPFFPLYFLDDILYRLYLPNLLNVIIFLIIIGFGYFIYKLINSNKELKY